MLNIKYLAMHTVQMLAGAKGKLLWGFAPVEKIIHLLKLVDYQPVQVS